MSLRPNVLKGLFQVFVQTLGANLSGFQAFAVENACGSLSKMFHISIWKFKSNARLNLFWPIFFELSPPEIFGDFRLRNQTLTTSYEVFPLFSELCLSENFHDWISENFHDWISSFRIWPIRNLSRLETPVASYVFSRRSAGLAQHDWPGASGWSARSFWADSGLYSAFFGQFWAK